MAMVGQTNITTFPDGTKPKLKKLGFDNYQCPFCEKVGPYHNLVPHLQSHQWSSIKYGGYNVYKCHLCCVASSHYHCAFCPKTIIRKETFITHFKKCLCQQQAMAVTVPPAVQAETRGPPVLPEETRGPPVLPEETSSPPVLPENTRGPPSETRVPPVLPEETKSPPVETRGSPAKTSDPPVGTRGPPAETRGPPEETRGPPMETTVPPVLPEETKGPPVETRGPPAKSSDPPVGTKGPPEETRGPPMETRDPPSETTVPPVLPEETKGPPVRTRGLPAKLSDSPVGTRGPPVETRGSPVETRGPPATLPAIQTNIIAFPDGTKPKLTNLGFDNYQCPFCKKVGPYHNLVPHLQSHQWSSVKYGGYNVYKCHLACEASSHYHCAFCPKTIIRKATFITHFKKCLCLQQAMAVPVPPAVPEETRGSSLKTRGPPSEPKGQPNKILLSKRKKTRCCFCNLVMQKKNLKVHIHRHHSSKMANISINHYLQSVCVDKKRGVFAVLMAFKGPAHYIHVQKCTWGEERRITCQLDACNRLYDYARRSGQISFECQHIQSLMFSPVPTDLPVLLDENILAEMVINKWFSKSTQNGCLRRKFAADADGALLSYEVNLVQEQGQHFFSVFEPRISSYSRLGRLMVHYNGVLNTWHCSCMKARKSCPHKAIAMWHMYQLKPDLFISSENGHEDLSKTFLAVTDPAVDTEAENIPLYTTEGEGQMIIVDYIIQ